MKKRERIEEQLETLAKRIANAEDYVARNVNVEGSAWLHTDDWNGRSGHPSWVKKHMIPTTKKWQRKSEKALETIGKRDHERRKQRRTPTKGS